MRNNTCIICSKEFEPREGRLYCSNACKQRAFTDNKQKIGAMEEKEREQKLNLKKLEFRFTEYEEYRKKFGDFSNFQLYCFFRKNLSGAPTLDEIHSYLISFDSTWWENFHGEDGWGNNTGVVSSSKKKYMEFEAKFFSDEVTIYFSNKSNENKSET